MESHDFFLHLLIILLTARLFAELATRLHSPPVIGELLAGIVLGPSLFGLIQPIDAIRLMAGIGIILLLFQVGLETDIRRLINTGFKSFIVALSGFVLPLILGFLSAFHIFNLSLLESMFIGGTLTATSIGITVRVLNNLSLQHHGVGQIVLGAAVLDDILGVILLALLYEFSTGGGINLINASKVFIFIAIFFLMAPIAAKLISFVIKRFAVNSQIPGLIPTTIVSLVLFFAWLAHSIGAPELLGGFAAGLALSRRFFLPLGIALRRDEAFASVIEQQMLPIVQLFTPIFFVVVGLSLNLREIDWSSPFIWIFSLVMLLVAIVAKLLGALFIREPLIQRLLIGVSMVPRGEVGLIFAELGRTSNIINNEIYAGLIIVIALTTLLSPFVIKCLATKLYT
ncbi:MAG: cation:proton antiporter [Gammaproteobacteria bacterium]